MKFLLFVIFLFGSANAVSFKETFEKQLDEKNICEKGFYEYITTDLKFNGFIIPDGKKDDGKGDKTNDSLNELDIAVKKFEFDVDLKSLNYSKLNNKCGTDEEITFIENTITILKKINKKEKLLTLERIGTCDDKNSFTLTLSTYTRTLLRTYSNMKNSPKQFILSPYIEEAKKFLTEYYEPLTHVSILDSDNERTAKEEIKKKLDIIVKASTGPKTVDNSTLEVYNKCIEGTADGLIEGSAKLFCVLYVISHSESKSDSGADLTIYNAAVDYLKRIEPSVFKEIEKLNGAQAFAVAHAFVKKIFEKSPTEREGKEDNHDQPTGGDPQQNVKVTKKDNKEKCDNLIFAWILADKIHDNLTRGSTSQIYNLSRKRQFFYSAVIPLLGETDGDKKRNIDLVSNIESFGSEFQCPEDSVMRKKGCPEPTSP